MHLFCFLSFCLLCGFAVSDLSDYGDTYQDSVWHPSPARGADTCVPVPLGGVDWILSVRGPDHGWREETHRAVIALAVAGWRKTADPEEVRHVDLQLEVELTRALLRNTTSPVHPNDLALYVHALIATRRNPRDFHGIDLLDRLDVRHVHQFHPFLLLALCNGGVLGPHNMTFQQWLKMNQLSEKQSTEYLAMSLNAYECLKADSFHGDDPLKKSVIKQLVSGQLSDGSFGNVYTTSLVMQALGSHDEWDRQSAVEYLLRQSTVDVNMVSTYLIQLALNVDRVRFIKDLHPGLNLGLLTVKQKDHHYVSYTIRIGKNPDLYRTVTIRVPNDSNFYDIMTLTAKEDQKFEFSSYLDKDGNPAIYSVSDVPNDAEQNLYWRVCHQTEVNHDRHTYSMRTIQSSPVKFFPEKDSHVILWYKQSECEETE